MNILHAHTDPDLLTRLRQMLGGSVRADIAVGYLFVSGFDALAPELERLERTRILVGRTDRPTLEEVARGLQQAEALRARVEEDGLVRRSAREGVGADAVRELAEGLGRLPQTAEAERGVRRIAELVTCGTLELRAYPRAMLHSKAYLCWYGPENPEPGAAIVGSSNFTLAGFTGNTELNVRVTGDAEMCELGRWFDELWADAVDVTQDMAVELRRSWAVARTSPYHVYLKALYELYGEELAVPALEPGRRGVPQLAEFQLDAVRRALRMVEQHGGCFVGDVVGLGKTYVGAELVRQLQLGEPPGRHPLIVCPAGLVPMWEVMSERFGLGAEVVSMSALAPPAGARYDEEREEYVEDAPTGGGIDLGREYPNRGVVLVDEAHNFRHAATRRYRALSAYLWSGERKVVLLSATPQNLGPADIYHQVRLFLDDVDHGLPIEPLHLEEYFGAVRRWYEHRVDLENWQVAYQAWQRDQGSRRGRPTAPPPQPEQPDEPYATMDQVLDPIFIRRRRRDIRELYGDEVEVGGRRVRFPEPVLDNITYRLDRVYARAGGSFEELQRLLNGHRGARYLAVEYLTPEAEGSGRYRDLLRASNRVARLMRYLLVKRLESSVAAFRSTLDVLLRSNRNFREALGEGFVPIGQTATNVLSGETFDVDELLGTLRREETRREATGARRSRLVHPTADFDTGRWLHDLDADYHLLERVRRSLDGITPEDDDKLRALRAFLARPEVAAGKVLVFSEAEATIEYLYEQLNPGERDPEIAKLSGSNRDAMQNIIKRFAPESNLRPSERPPGPPVRVLLATDVVSEGQNLQDCNRVVNYDLHWNPVRLIQRFGRVDRIGTAHERIYLHNTWPDTDVDADLALTARLGNRIQAFHDFIGLDARLLSENERLNPSAMYRIYEQMRLPEANDGLDELSASQRGVALLQKLQKEDPELWRTVAALPDGLRAALPARPPERDERALIDFQRTFGLEDIQLPLTSPQTEAGLQSPLDDPAAGETVALFEHGGGPSAYAVGSKLQARRLTPAQLLAAMECAPDTPASPLPPDTNARVVAAFAAARAEASGRLGRARRPGTDSRVRRHVSRQLRLARELAGDDQDELRRITILQRVYGGPLPAGVLETLKDSQRLEIGGEPFLRRLEALRERYRLTPRDEEEGSAAPPDAEVTRTVCSTGLLEPYGNPRSD